MGSQNKYGENFINWTIYWAVIQTNFKCILERKIREKFNFFSDMITDNYFSKAKHSINLKLHKIHYVVKHYRLTILPFHELKAPYVTFHRLKNIIFFRIVTCYHPGTGWHGVTSLMLFIHFTPVHRNLLITFQEFAETVVGVVKLKFCSYKIGVLIQWKLVLDCWNKEFNMVLNFYNLKKCSLLPNFGS